VNHDLSRLTADGVTASGRGPVGAMEIEAFIDLICPRCYIAVRHLSDALSMFAYRRDVRIVWRSFQLDAIAGCSFDEVLIRRVMRNHGMTRREATEVAASVTTKLCAVAKGAGLIYDPGVTTRGDTLAAHRLVQLAAAHGVADLAVERIQRAYFERGMAIDDCNSLSGLAVELGLDPEAAQLVGCNDVYAEAIAADRDLAERRGITSVPLFICDGRFVVSGTSSPRWLHHMMRAGWSRRCRETG
jgi:predicted DsbA family dithiol-disulfide isomerase